MSVDQSLNQLPLGQLSDHCGRETEKFYRSGRSDDRYCFELFRRAIVEQTAEAWNHIFERYSPLVAGWVSRHQLFAMAQEERGYFVNRAFERMWRAMSPEKFGRMANLKTLIAYLKMCVHAAVVEHVERRTSAAEWSETDMSGDLSQHQAGDNPATAVASDSSAIAIWQAVVAITKDDAELTVARCTFIYDMKPREIYEQHVNLFKNVNAVYRCKENLLARLRRHESLQNFLQVDG